MSQATVSIEQLAINTIRTLSMDAVQAANSGHPGTPMALAPVAYALWQRQLRYDPQHPLWPNRDRFVLSCGHASMLIYSMLHLTSVKQVDAQGQPTDELAVSLDEIKQFRQLHSKTPGHPEFGHTSGVETTTGPLGQGVGNSVGMAIASRYLAARYNRPDFELFNFDTYALCSDGDLMEGVGGEAASLAGHLKLANLCWIYDDNSITIEGNTSLAYSEDVALRFQGYRWHTISLTDANDTEALTAALEEFKKVQDRPTIIIVKSHIAWGAPNKQDTHGAHGAPLGADEIKATKQVYGWPEEENFLVPPEVPEHFSEGIGQRGRELRQAWEAKFAEYQSRFPELAQQLQQMQQGELPDNWHQGIPTFPTDMEKGMASRSSGGKVMQAVGQGVPWLIGGSADLAPSTKTLLEFEDAGGSFAAGNYAGRNLHFGVREHAMAAAVNGMTLCGLRGYGSTFLVFSDYCRPSLRLAAIMRIPSLFIFTHDSIGVGEDGPTHQPIEHVAALRTIPDLLVFRPGDANEVAECWKAMLNSKDRPSSLVLTRQNIPTLDREKYHAASGVAQGGYILAGDPGVTPQVILIGTGSEVSLCVKAYETLMAEGITARVVSMPCRELFELQSEDYRQQVLPDSVIARVVVEMATPFGWDRYVGMQGKTLCIDHYGASAPGGQVAKEFGFTPERVVELAKSLLS